MPDRALSGLQRLHEVKSSTKRRPPGVPLGEEMLSFFRHSVQKRQSRLELLADCWAKLVPPLLSDHCALESYSRNTLTVLVDTSSHLYELKQLLLAGVERQLLVAAKTTGLRKIALKPGRWYDQSGPDKRLKFK